MSARVSVPAPDVPSRTTDLIAPPVTSTTVQVDAIRVEDRARREYAGIDTLAASIASVGLLHPIVVTPDLRLVVGGRRLEAVRALGWESVAATVANSLTEAADLLQAESDENTERMPLRPSEAADLARKIEEVLAPLAADRVGGRPSKTAAKLAGVSEPRPRDVAAKAAGIGHESIRKVRLVQEIIESDTTPATVRELAITALAEIDETGKIDAGHRKVRDAVTVAELVAEFPELQHYVDHGDTGKAIQLGTALRGYVEPELTMRLNNLRLSIAADLRRAPATDQGPDYYKLADRIFLAVNDAMQVIAKSGGVETVKASLESANSLTLDLWRTQFEEAAEVLTALADTVRPTLKAVK